MNVELIQTIATIFADIVGIYLCFYFYDGVLERRKMSKAKFTTFIISSITILIIVNLSFPKTTINQITSLIIYISIVLFAFNSKKLVAILLAIFYVIFGTLAELIVGVLMAAFLNVSLLEITEVEMFYVAGVIMSKIGLFLIISLVIRFLSKKENSIPFNVWLVLTILPIISLYIALYIVSLQIQVTKTDLSSVVAVLGLLIMNVVAVAAFEYNQRRADEINLYKQANATLNIEQEHYQQMIASHKVVRGLWHDMNNHFITIGTLLEEAKIAESLDYVYNIQEVLSDSMKHNVSGNIVVDAILGNKIERARKLGITIQHTIAIPKELHIGPLDLSTILGNVLDNAIEACSRINNTERTKNIVLSMGYDNQTLYFKVKNPMNSKTIKKKEDRYMSSKSITKHNHGYGLLNIQNVIDKYSGHLSIKTKDEYFTISLVIPEYI